MTSLVCPPDTDPVLDEPGLVEMLKFRARNLNQAHVLSARRADRRPEGRGADRDGRAHRSRLRRLLAGRGAARRTRTVLLRALQYAATFGYTVWLRPQDAALGAAASRTTARSPRAWACRGVPVMAETIALRPIFDSCATPARAFICAACRAPQAWSWCAPQRREGLPVTCDVGIHHAHLIRDATSATSIQTARLTPPLRSQRDRDALRAALADGTATRSARTTRRSTTTRSSCRSAKPSPARPVLSYCYR